LLHTFEPFLSSYGFLYTSTIALLCELHSLHIQSGIALKLASITYLQDTTGHPYILQLLHY